MNDFESANGFIIPYMVYDCFFCSWLPL